MLFEKKIILGYCIINKLVENYDRDSSISFSSLIEYIQINYSINIRYEEVYEIIDLINTSSSRHDVLEIINSSNILLFEPIIISERRVEYLKDILEKFQEEMDYFSNII